jgi:hypothetical protein
VTVRASAALCFEGTACYSWYWELTGLVVVRWCSLVLGTDRFSGSEVVQFGIGN